MASSIKLSCCSCILLLSLLVSFFSFSSAHELGGIRVLRGHGAGRKVGGWMDVEDVETNEEVQALGRFAVDEHNRRGGGGGGRLVFKKVVVARRQVVSAIKYYLLVAAQDEGGNGGGDGEGVFDAVVVVKPWLEKRALLSFAPAAPQQRGRLFL